MLITRYAKIVMAGCLAAFCLLVTFDNIADWSSNYLYVQHVLSMDTTFPGNAVMYRAVTSPALWKLAFGIIIALQLTMGVLYLAGAIRLFQVRHAPGAEFDRAKGHVIAASLIGFFLFFFLFMVVGGEWFAMWQSATWNAQQAAFRFYMAVLGVLIFVNQRDADLLAPAPTQRAAPKAKPARTPRRRRTDKSRRHTDRN